MKKGIVITLIFSLLAFSGLTYADTSTEIPRVQERANRLELGERLEKGLRPEQGQKPENGERQEIWRNNLTEVINTYAPEVLADFTSAWAEHDAIHVELQSIRIAAQANNQLEIDAIKAKVVAKEITFAEAKELLKAHHESNRSNRDAIQAEIEALKAANGQDPEVVKETLSTLKMAIESEDADSIFASLNTLLEILEKHINFDQMKLELVQ